MPPKSRRVRQRPGHATTDAPCSTRSPPSVGRRATAAVGQPLGDGLQERADEEVPDAQEESTPPHLLHRDDAAAESLAAPEVAETRSGAEEENEIARQYASRGGTAALAWRHLLLNYGGSAGKAQQQSPGSYISHCREGAPALESPIPDRCQPWVIDADIARSLWHGLPVGRFAATEGDARSEDEVREDLRRALKEVVLRALAGDPGLHYYQGMHEVFAVVLLSSARCSVDDVAHTAALLAALKLRSFAGASMDQAEGSLWAMHHVLCAACGGNNDKTDAASLPVLLERSGLAPQSHYALPWVITWFSHQLSDRPVVLMRLFDFLIGAEEDGPAAIVCLCAALLFLQRDYLVKRVFDDGDAACEDNFGMLYAEIAALPHSIVADDVCAAKEKSPDQEESGPPVLAVNVIVEEAAKIHRMHGWLVNGKIDEFCAAQAATRKSRAERVKATSKQTAGAASPSFPGEESATGVLWPREDEPLAEKDTFSQVLRWFRYGAAAVVIAGVVVAGIRGNAEGAGGGLS